MSLNIYLFFDGNCREAFDFYKSVFGGEFAGLSTFADAPAEMGVPAEHKDRIMHVALPVSGSILMGSDGGGVEGGPLTKGDNFSISINAESREECDEIFPRLCAGGEVTMPLQETFWAAYFGMCRDRFGIKWMINHDLSKAAG